MWPYIEEVRKETAEETKGTETNKGSRLKEKKIGCSKIEFFPTQKTVVVSPSEILVDFEQKVWTEKESSHKVATN